VIPAQQRALGGPFLPVRETDRLVARTGSPQFQLSHFWLETKHLRDRLKRAERSAQRFLMRAIDRKM
jgi:hypothetical protein